MKRSQFITLVAAISLSVVAGMVASAMLGLDDSGLEGEEGSRSQAPLRLSESTGETLVTGLPDFTGLVQRANPAVVSVTNVRFRASRNPHQDLSDDPFWRWFFQREESPERPDQPDTRRFESGGSGFVISPNGYLLTNHHVVEEADRVMVRFLDGGEYQAQVMGTDSAIDLALLKIEGEGFPSLPLGRSGDLRVGEWVLAIGNPMNFAHTVTAGVVSAKGRRLPLTGVDPSISSFIQTDAAINFGNSGGPLLNTRGEVVGINTAISRGGMNGLVQGIGFALPIDTARDVLDQLRDTGRVSRGYLGVSIQDVNPLIQESYGLEEARGALIGDVEPGTPADEAGLEPGELILGLNGEAVEDTAGLIARVSALPPGETVELEVRTRAGGTRRVSVTLGDRAQLTGRTAARPEESLPEEEVIEMGFRVEPLTRSERRRFGVPDLEGVLVADVDSDSEAWDAGLREGQVIVELNREEVRDLDEYRSVLRGVDAGSVLSLRVVDPPPFPIRPGESLRGRYLFFRVP